MTQLSVDTTKPHLSTFDASHFIWAGRSLVECKIARETYANVTDTHADLFVHTTESAIREALFNAALAALRMSTPTQAKEYDAETRYREWASVIAQNHDVQELIRFSVSANVNAAFIAGEAVNRERMEHAQARTAWLERKARDAANAPKDPATLTDAELWHALENAEARHAAARATGTRARSLAALVEYLKEADARGYSRSQLKLKVEGVKP